MVSRVIYTRPVLTLLGCESVDEQSFLLVRDGMTWRCGKTVNCIPKLFLTQPCLGFCLLNSFTAAPPFTPHSFSAPRVLTAATPACSP